MGKNLKSQRTFRVTPDEAALLERLAERHGGVGAAIIAGLRALEMRNEPSNAELVDMLKRRLMEASDA